MPTKTSSAPGGAKTIDRPTAWACTVTNLCTLPGLGSIAAGRAVGYGQAAAAALGFALSLVWFIDFLRTWLSTGEVALEFRPSFLLGLGGVGLYGSAWLWALGTSISLLRQARSADAPPAAAAVPRPPPR